MKVIMDYDLSKVSGLICIPVVAFKNYELPGSHISAKNSEYLSERILFSRFLEFLSTWSLRICSTVDLVLVVFDRIGRVFNK